jgi:hypothetical protein
MPDQSELKKIKNKMEYKVNVTILDRGFIVDDNGHKSVCNDVKELGNCLARTKQAAETDIEGSFDQHEYDE